MDRFNSFLLNLSVTCPSLISASSPNPFDIGRVVPISLTGNVVPREVSTEMLFMYPTAMPCELLQAALGHTLNSFPVQAGRIKADESGRLFITQNNAGAVWFEAEADGITLAKLLPPHQLHGDGSMVSSWCYDDFPCSLFPSGHYSRPQLDGPTLMVQATRLRQDGSMLLSVWMDHACHDVCSFLQFVNGWAAVAKVMHENGALSPPPGLCFPVPVYDAELIDSAACASMEFDHSVDFVLLEAAAQAQDTAQPPPPSRGTLYHFSVAQLTRLKEVAVRALKKLPVGERPPYISTMDALQAHLWSVINEARQVKTSQRPLRFMQTITARGDRLQPQLPTTFSGAAHFETSCHVPGDAASDDDPTSLLHLGQRAAALRNRILTVTQPRFIASLLFAYSKIEPRSFRWPVPFGHQSDLTTSSWQAFSGMHSADFGFGCPAAGNYNLPPFVGNAFILLPSPVEISSLDVWIGQTTEAYVKMMKVGRMFDFVYQDNESSG